MTDPKTDTVAVPVELIKDRVRDYEQGGWTAVADAWRALLPKPKPRFVAISREQFRERYFIEWFDAQPDLLTLLDALIEDVVREDLSGYGQIKVTVRNNLKARIRAALGVTE